MQGAPPGGRPLPLLAAPTALALAAAHTSPKAAPSPAGAPLKTDHGVTASEIHLGATLPLSDPFSSRAWPSPRPCGPTSAS